MNFLLTSFSRKWLLVTLLASASCIAWSRPYPKDQFADMVARRDAQMGALIKRSDVGIVHSPCVDEKTRQCKCNGTGPESPRPHAHAHWFNNDIDFPAVRYVEGSARKAIDPEYMKFFQQAALDPIAAACPVGANGGITLHVGFYDTMSGGQDNKPEVVATVGFKKDQNSWRLDFNPEPLIWKSMTRAEMYNKGSNWYAWLRKADHDAFIGRSPESAPNRKASADQKAVALADCSRSGMFCDLPAGDYFNAIYQGDAELFFSTDEKYMETARKHLVYADMSKISTLRMTVKKYIYDYGDVNRKCLRNDHIVSNISGKDSDTYDTRTTIGARGRIGVENVRKPGNSYAFSVRFNKEFTDACSMFCDGQFNSSIDSNLQTIVTGLKQLMTTHSCDSPEVKQFERNLLELFRKFYVEKGSKY